MKLLLISNSTNFGETYLGWCQSQIDLFCLSHDLTSQSNFLFIPFAGVYIQQTPYPKSYDEYEKRVKNVFAQWGYLNFSSIHGYENKEKAVKNADCIIVGGGNTFHLVAEMHHFNLMKIIQEKVKSGTPYIGWSAGANLACPGLFTTNDMPIVQPKSFEALNLVPFQINPHYLDPTPEIDKMIKHGGETRQDRLNEYLAANQKKIVVGLREGCALWINEKKMTMRGGKKLVVLKYQQPIEEFEPQTDLSFLL